MSTAFIALGSNSTDSMQQLKSAWQALNGLAFTKLRRTSNVYRTKPWGDLDQPDFLNAVLELHSELAPMALLDELQRIENNSGRIRETGRQFGPRTLDLDLLMFGQMQMQSARLDLPHPRMHRRAFVLVPLLNIAPDVKITSIGTAQELLANLSADEINGVTLFCAATELEQM